MASPGVTVHQRSRRGILPAPAPPRGHTSLHIALSKETSAWVKPAANLATQNPEKVAELQQRIETLARQAVQPLFVVDALGSTKHVLFGSVATSDEEKNLELQP